MAKTEGEDVKNEDDDRRDIDSGDGGDGGDGGNSPSGGGSPRENAPEDGNSRSRSQGDGAAHTPDPEQGRKSEHRDRESRDSDRGRDLDRGRGRDRTRGHAGADGVTARSRRATDATNNAAEERGQVEQRWQQLARALDSAGLTFAVNEDEKFIQLAFQTEHYRNPQGEKAILLFLTVRDSGQLVLVEAPFLYRLRDARSRGTARKAILYANFAVKSIQYSVDPGDGDEVRGRIELWQHGIDMNPEYIRSHLDRLASQIDHCDRILRPVWKRGRRELDELVKRDMEPEKHRRKSSRAGRGSPDRIPASEESAQQREKKGRESSDE
jgi:hypothetical protein